MVINTQFHKNKKQKKRKIVRACSMFFPCEGCRSVTPLDAARVNRMIFHNHSVHWYYITLIEGRGYIKDDIIVWHGQQNPHRGRKKIRKIWRGKKKCATKKSGKSRKIGKITVRIHRKKSDSTRTACILPVQYWARYSAGWLVQVPGIVQVKSLDTDSALNSAGPALLRAIPL